MNHHVSKFMEAVLGEIKYKKIHPYILHEINDHIECLKEDYEADGLNEEMAYEKAVGQMGDALDIGRTLHQMHKPKMEWSVFTGILLLIGIGLYSINLLSMGYGQDYYIKKHITWLILGGIGFAITYFIDYKKLEHWSWGFYGLALGLLVYTVINGSSINGSTRWIHIGPFSFASAIIVTPLLILAFIGFIRKWANGNIKELVLLGLLGAAPIFFIMAQPNVIRAGLFGIAFMGLFTYYVLSSSFKGSKVKVLGITYGMVLGVGGSFLGYMLLANPYSYKLERLKQFFGIIQDPKGVGYLPNQIANVIQASQFIANDGMSFNEGPLGGLDRLALASDYIFTFIVATMGQLAGIVLIALVLFIIIRMFTISIKINDNYGKLIVIGVGTAFMIQAIYNICVNLGWAPLGETYLPFVSFGGSNIVCDMILMGLLLNVYRRKDIVKLALENF